jgi:hypothetical protein
MASPGWRLKRSPTADEMAENPTPDLLDNLDVHLERVAKGIEKIGRGSPEQVANDKSQAIAVVLLLAKLWRAQRGLA